MNIYRNEKDGRLYSICTVSPPKVIGQWNEANALYGEPRKIKINNSNKNNFTIVSQKQGNFTHLLP